MKETTKADKRRFEDYLYKRILKGNGIDIGCGDDCFGQGLFKNQVNCEPFDIINGDAQEIHRLVNKQYDFVYSSNCLEHMNDPIVSLENWLKIVKLNGYLIVIVPDEDLYEQGHFPSIFNSDHKWTFTIFKDFSLNKRSLNIIQILQKFSHYTKILRVQVADNNFDYTKNNIDQTLTNAEAFIEFVLQKTKE
jgi:SAM-dependent methyltransferase